MSDPISSNSTVPLPSAQTLDGKAIVRSDTTRSETAATGKRDDFKDYLDQTSITLVQKQGDKAHADAADLLDQASVYKLPGHTVPL